MILDTDGTTELIAVPELTKRQHLNVFFAELACERFSVLRARFPRAFKAAGYSTEILREPEEAAAIERELEVRRKARLLPDPEDAADPASETTG